MQAVIFDLDGLLVDTEPLHYRSWRDTLAEVEILIDWDEYRERWIRAGEGIEDYLAVFGASHDPVALRRRKRARYLPLLEDEGQPMPGALELLATLRPRVRLAVASSGFRVDVEAALRTLRIAEVFAVVATNESAARRKPHPDIFIYTAQALGVPPETCVVLEDAEKGVLAARRAGMAVVGVPTVHTRANDFSQATWIAASLRDVTCELLERLVASNVRQRPPDSGPRTCSECR